MEDLMDFLKFFAAVVSFLVAASALLQHLERARRELASSLIYSWANDIDWPTSRAVKLAKKLPKEILAKILDEKNEIDVAISITHYDGVMSVLRGNFPDGELPSKPESPGQTFRICSEQGAYIRFLCTRWLDRLEGTLAAWQQGAADADLMDKEFSPLLQGREAEIAILTEHIKGLPVLTLFSSAKSGGGMVARRPLGIFPWDWK